MGIAAELLGVEGSPWKGGESPGGGNVVAARYRVGEREETREVGVTWGSSPLGPSFTITLYNSSPSRPHRLICPLSLSPLSLFHRPPSHASLSSLPPLPPVEVFWDCSRATFRTSPEPVSHFYVALVSGGSVILLLGDMSKEALRRIRRFLKKSETFSSSSVKFGSNSGRYRSISEKFGSNSDRFGSNSGRFGSNSGRFGFRSEKIGSNSEKIDLYSGKVGWVDSEKSGGKMDEGRFGRTKVENFGRRQWGGKGKGLKWGLGLGSAKGCKKGCGKGDGFGVRDGGNDFREGIWKSGNQEGNRIFNGNLDRNGNGNGNRNRNRNGNFNRNGDGNENGDGNSNGNGKKSRQEIESGAEKNIGKSIGMQVGGSGEEGKGGVERDDGSWEGSSHINEIECESVVGTDGRNGNGNGNRARDGDGDGNDIEIGKGNRIGNRTMTKRRKKLRINFDLWSRKLYGDANGNPYESETGPGSETSSKTSGHTCRESYRNTNWNWNWKIGGKKTDWGNGFGSEFGSGFGSRFGRTLRGGRFGGAMGENRKNGLAAAVPVELLARRECVFGRHTCEGRARLAPGGREHLVHAQVESGSKLVVRVDGEVAIQVDRLQWHFRGNKTILVDGEPIDVFWDVYNWLFGGFAGYAVFLFRSDSPVSSAGNSPAGGSSLSAGISSDTTDSFPETADSSSDDGLDVMPYWTGTDRRAYAQAWLGKGGLGCDAIAEGDCDSSGFSLTLVAWRHDLGSGK